MGSNRLPFGLISGQQRTEQYHWQQLTLRQREHGTREQQHRGATLNYPPYRSSRDRVEHSVAATEISCRSRGYYDSHRYGGETVNNICYSRSETKNFNKWNQPLDRPGLLELKRYRRSTSPRCGVNRSEQYSSFYDHEHPSEIRYPENGIGAPRHLSSCSYSHLFENKIGGYHGQGHAYHSHSSKRARHSFSPGPAPTRSYRTERSPSFDGVRDYAKGADGHMDATARLGKVFPFNHGSSTRNRHYQEDRYLPTKVDFLGGHFSEIDEARHRSYMDNFCIYKKHEGHSWEDPSFNISDHTSLHDRYELGGAHTKKPSDEFDAIHHEQLELSPSEDFHDHLDSSRNCRNGYNGKMLRRKWPKRGFQENNSNGACVSRHWRNSRQKRYGDHLDEQKAMKNIAYEDQSKGYCHLNEQHQQPCLHDEVHNGGSDVMRNDNREGNTEISKEVGQNGAKGNCHPKKNILTAATCSGSTKSDENSDVLSPKYSSKTIASSDVPKQSEGSSNTKTESDKRPSDIGCTKRTRNMRTEEVSRGNPQHPPVTHIEKGVHTKESDNISPSEVLRDCLNLWRRLRKDSGTEAEKVMQTDKIGTVQTSNGGRARNGRVCASGVSESNDENDSVSESGFGSSERDAESDSASENSEQCRSAMSYGVQKFGEERPKRKPEQPFGCLSGSNRNKSPQNTMAEQGLKCNLEFPPEANPGEITQQKEQDKLSCCLLSAAHPDARILTSWNSCSDTSKMDQAAAAHPDSSVRQKVSQHEATNDHLDARKKYKLGVSCDIKKKAEGDGAKWGEQMASSSAGSTLLDQKTVALCSMHDHNLEVNALECSNQDSKNTTRFSVPKLDKGTANNCAKKPVNWSSGSAFRNIQTLPKGGDCRDIQWDTKYCNILKNKQECSPLADSENSMRQKETTEDYEPPQALEVPSNQQISHQFDSDRTNSGVARRADWTSCSAIPDLNSLPSMDTNEEFKASEEVIYQIPGDGSKPQNASKRLSAPFSGPTVQEELFKQPEPNELIRGICKREGANRLPISNSHSGPPQVSTVEGRSASIDAFKRALCDFIKNILKPMWEDGLLSREVHKIIVKKAVEKVTVALASKIPLTEIAICRFLSEESQSVEKLVQGYLDVYVGRQVLKRTMPDNI